MKPSPIASAITLIAAVLVPEESTSSEASTGTRTQQGDVVVEGAQVALHFTRWVNQLGGGGGGGGEAKIARASGPPVDTRESAASGWHATTGSTGTHHVDAVNTLAQVRKRLHTHAGVRGASQTMTVAVQRAKAGAVHELGPFVVSDVHEHNLKFLHAVDAISKELLLS